MTKERHICEKMLEMLECKPYDKIKVSDFVKFAGVSRSTFYFYFDSIESVIDMLEDSCIGALSNPTRLAASLASRDYDASESLLALNKQMVQQLRTFRILSGENGRRKFQEKMYQRVLKIHQLYYGSNSSDPKFVELTSEFFSGAQLNVYRWWANHADEVTLADINRYTLMIFDSIVQAEKKRQ